MVLTSHGVSIITGEMVKVGEKLLTYGLVINFPTFIGTINTPQMNRPMNVYLNLSGPMERNAKLLWIKALDIGGLFTEYVQSFHLKTM